MKLESTEEEMAGKHKKEKAGKLASFGVSGFLAL
jgi:hypothetical protein